MMNNQARAGVCLLLGLVLVCGWASAQPPAGYYSSATGLTGTALRDALHDIIDNHNPVPYSSSSFDTRDAINILQEDPSNSNNVILIYSGFSVPKSSWPAYNREHIWPTSLGAEVGVADRDLHNIYACDTNVNSQRGNKHFGECSSSCSSHPEAPLCDYTNTLWEPRASEKGDIARALFYMDVRYSGDLSNEADLVLTGTASSIGSGCICMGDLDELLDWHAQDPVDAKEIARNNQIFIFQGNRNPFVDDPSWVADIFGGTPGGPGGGGPGSGGAVWINEMHYDNGGSDTQEGIEIAGPAGTSLSGYRLEMYNGSNSGLYDTVPLTGTLADQQSGFGTLWFAVPGLQNGAPDGVALVASDNSVLQFISYEGVFTASDGAALGMLSVSIGVEENGGTLAGESLQLVGTGSVPDDFTWAAPAAHSRGAINPGQTLVPVSRGTLFIRGDCNGDGLGDLSDPIALLSWLFASGTLDCASACDRDDSGSLNLGDAVALLNALFQVVAPPEAPYPGCGTDPMPDALDCISYPGC